MAESDVSFLGPSEVRDLAAELDIVPTKKLGQNFVHDPNTVRRIVAAAELSADSYPVEVGPGLGSLTIGLLERCGRAAAVEIDPRLAQRLPRTVAERAPGRELELIAKDALQIQAADFQIQPDALVANLPYNVSVPVLLHMLAQLPTIRTVLVMVQSEVADRLAAQPGSKIYGVPSVKAAYYGRVRRAGAIGPHVFWPVPKVDSGLVRIDCYSRSGGGGKPAAPWEISPEFRARLFPLIDAAFAQRRKTLRAALSGVYGSGAAAEEALLAAGIDPKQRGEKLDIADFVRLTQVSR